MAKTKVSEWSTTATDNADIGGTDIAENCAPGNLNDAVRKVMAQIAAARTGSDDGMVTGTAGSDTNLAQWNADGDVVGLAAATLLSLNALATAANKGFYATAANTVAEFDLTALARDLLDDADQSTMRATLQINDLTQAQAEDATSTTLGRASGQLLAQAIDARSAPFVSTSQTVTSGGALTIAHGLPYTPLEITGVLIFTSAVGGYSIGDKVPISPNSKADGSGHFGFTCVPDATNLNIRFSNNSSATFTLNRFDTGGDINISDSDVTIQFIARGDFT